MIVMKFGGTSVKDVAAVRRLVDIIRREKRPKVVVVSALSKVTDALIEVGRLAEHGDAEAAAEAVRALHRRHQEMCAVVASPERRPELLVALDELFAELSAIVHALAVVEEVSPRSADTIVSFGELASSRIVAAAFDDAGLRGRFVDARQVLVTDAQHGAAQPDRAATDERLRSLVRPLVEQGLVPVLGGFIGGTTDGAHDDARPGRLGLLGGPRRRGARGRGDPDLDRRRRDADRRSARRREPARRPAAELRRGLGARVLRREGAPPQHHPPGRRPRHPGAHPELPPAGGEGHADHERAEPERRRTGRDRVQARRDASSTSPPRAC